MKGGEALPLRPWADAVYKTRLADLGKDDPTSNCIVGGVPRNDFVPYPFKILETPGNMVILYEAIHSFRQIFTDGRALPTDPNPAWLGYSVGRWEKDVFVVESAGFNDNVWLDNAGCPRHRAAQGDRALRPQGLRAHGHRDHDRRSEDLHKKWEMVQPLLFQADNEIIEYICDENNRYFDLVPHAQPPGESPGTQHAAVGGSTMRRVGLWTAACLLLATHGHAIAGATASPGTPKVFQQQTPQEWSTYSNRVDRFEVNLPGQPKVEDIKWPSEYGAVFPARVYSLEQGGGRYSVTVVDYTDAERIHAARTNRPKPTACPSTGSWTCRRRLPTRRRNSGSGQA